MGDQYYGAKASLNVWAPHVNNPNEFSLSQMWVISGSFGNDLNTIEAGSQVLNFFYYCLFLVQSRFNKTSYKKYKLDPILCYMSIFKVLEFMKER